MIPKTPGDWNIQIIKHLLEEDYQETEDFDFKEMLPYKDEAGKEDKKGKQRLIKTCCAFANSKGGFLIFGIADRNKGLAPEKRLVGVSSKPDFFEQFGNYPRQCEPPVLWQPRNPNLKLESGNEIPIIYIPRSLKGPHSFRSPEFGEWRGFAKRTNKGDEDMTYEEIRAHFLFQAELAKLQVLKRELEEMVSQIDDKFSTHPTEFRLEVLEELVADITTTLVAHPQLQNAIDQIRRWCAGVNDIIHEKRRSGISNLDPLQRARMHGFCNALRYECRQASAQVELILAS